MTQQYVAMIQDLQITKKQLGSLRKKYNTVQSDNIVLKDNQQTLKRALNTLKDRNQILEGQNSMLRKQNQRIIQQYQRDIGAIRAEVDKKQEGIRQLQLLGDTQNLNANLLRKQIQCQIQSNFKQQIEKKDNKILELQAKLDSIKRQKQLQKQKFDLKLKNLQKSLQQAQARHIQQIKDYANKLYLQTQRKTASSDDTMIKRLRRQLDCLRNLLNDKDSQIQNLFNQKTQIMLEKGNAVNGQQKQKEQLIQKLTDYKRDLQRVKSQKDLSLVRQQNKQIRLNQRQLKKLKQQILSLQQQSHQKDLQIQQHKLRQKQLTSQIQRVEQTKKQYANRKLQDILQQNTRLQNQIRNINQKYQTVQQKYNNIVNQGQEVNYISDINNRYENRTNNMNTNTNTRNVRNRTNVNQNNIQDIRNIDNKNQRTKKYTDVNQQQQNVNKKNVNKKVIYNEENIVQERNIKNIKRINNEDVQNQQQNIRNENDKNINTHVNRNRNNDVYQEFQREQSPFVHAKVQKQREKVREIARKYIDLQKKYEKCKRKLDEANNKVLQLLRNKIAMASPPKTTYDGVFKSNGKNDPQAADYNKKGFMGSDNKIHSTGNNFYRSSSPKNSKYYQKSLSFKSKNKTKDHIKCLNHDHSQGECQND